MLKVFLLLLSGLLVVLTSTFQQKPQVQCVTEQRARKHAERTELPVYPEESEPGSSQGVVFATVLFDTDGVLSKVKFYETPNQQASEAVKKALQQWKLKQLFDGGGTPLETRTAIRFHFVFEDGKGRVDVATETEQLEFGGKWGTKVCKSSFDE